MLSTIVLYEEINRRRANTDPREVLVRTLASLVAPNIERLLGDVMIVGPPGKDLGAIADHAGCGFIEVEREAERLLNGLAQIRFENVFILRSGFALEGGFSEELADLTRLYSNGLMPSLRLRAQAVTTLERLVPHLAEPAGLIAAAARGRAAPAGGFAAFMRFMRPEASLRSRARRVF